MIPDTRTKIDRIIELYPYRPFGLVRGRTFGIVRQQQDITGQRYASTGQRYALTGLRYALTGLRYASTGLRYALTGLRYALTGRQSPVAAPGPHPPCPPLP